MSDRDDLGLFAGYGIEIEYMVVEADRLDVLPCVDALFGACAGPGADALSREHVSWSNELVNHVIELKTSGPATALAGLAGHFHAELRAIEEALESFGGRLMPGGMHPWMQPAREMQLFPSGQNEIYAAFDRIFGCRHHGFANLQSTHINLPFQGDAEFARLHAAVRAVLPLVPALAAASPILEGRDSGEADHRLSVYRENCRRLPSVTGRVIPDSYASIGAYQDMLRGLYADIAPLDPEGLLQFEWLNARGAIARFDRNCIEIRLMDAQECPRADLAIVELLVATVRALCEERWASLASLQALPTESLVALLGQGIRDAEAAQYEDRPWLASLGRSGSASARRLLDQLSEQLAGSLSSDAQRVLEQILAHGSLASRLRQGLPAGLPVPADTLRARYRELSDCLRDNRLYLP